jgi:hypothetical protein
MSKLLSGSICLTDIPKDKIWKSEKTGKQYLNINVWINDDADKFGNNGSIQVNQTKEEREAKDTKVYVGNLKFVEAKQQNAAANVPVKKSAPAAPVEDAEIVDDDLPF